MIVSPFSISVYFIFLGIFLLFGNSIQKYSPFFKSNSHLNYNHSMEGLRGILALNVLFSHAGFHYNYHQTGNWNCPSVFYQLLGPNSVTLFFMISGFLFWRKFLEPNKKHNWGTFFRGRILRILPAAWFSVAIVFLLVFIQSHFQILVSVKALTSSLLRWVTFGFYEINSFKDAALINGGVFWTLRQEWFFYFSLPLISFFAKKNRTLIFLLIVWGGYEWLESSKVVSLFFPTETQGYAQIIINFFSYLKFGFGWGMLAACAYIQRPSIPILKNRLASILALLCWGVAQSSFHNRIYQCLLLFIVFIVIVYENNLLGILSSNSAQFLGQVSYSIYLLHGIVLWTLRGIEGESATRHWFFLGVAGLLTIFFSALSYRYIEYPFLTWRGFNYRKKQRLESIPSNL